MSLTSASAAASNASQLTTPPITAKKGLSENPSMTQVPSNAIAIHLRETANILSNELKLPEDLSHKILSWLPAPLDEAKQAVKEAKDDLYFLVDSNLHQADQKKLAKPLLEKLATAEKRLQWETAVNNLKTSIDANAKPEKIVFDFLKLLSLHPDVAAAPRDRELQERATIATLHTLGLSPQKEKEILGYLRPDLSEETREALLRP